MILSRSVTVIDGSTITVEIHGDEDSARLSHISWTNGLADRCAVRYTIEDGQRNVVWSDLGYWQQGEIALPAVDLDLVMFDWVDVHDLPETYGFGMSLERLTGGA